MASVSTGESEIGVSLNKEQFDATLVLGLAHLPRLIFDQVTTGSGWPAALQSRLTVVPARTLMEPGPPVSRMLADSRNVEYVFIDSNFKEKKTTTLMNH